MSERVLYVSYEDYIKDVTDEEFNSIANTELKDILQYVKVGDLAVVTSWVDEIRKTCYSTDDGKK